MQWKFMFWKWPPFLEKLWKFSWCDGCRLLYMSYFWNYDLGFGCFECVSKFWHNIDISISAVNVQSLKFFALFYFPSDLRLAPVYTIHIQTWDHKKSLSRLKFRFFDNFWDNLQVMQPKNFWHVFNKLTTLSHLKKSEKIWK